MIALKNITAVVALFALTAIGANAQDTAGLGISVSPTLYQAGNLAVVAAGQGVTLEITHLEEHKGGCKLTIGIAEFKDKELGAPQILFSGDASSRLPFRMKWLLDDSKTGDFVVQAMAQYADGSVAFSTALLVRVVAPPPATNEPKNETEPEADATKEEEKADTTGQDSAKI